ncbi:MAG: IS1595 family transposase [Bacteroidetes bacterium]|nr:IS1595 family transposase [Bacteroidota bacterium]
MQFKSLPQILNYFKDEDTCIKFLEDQRWNGKPVCPKCGYSEKIYTIEGGKRYKCGSNTCNKKFSVIVGTIFENTKKPLNIWFAAIYLATAHKKGISSLQLHRDLGITQKTAWFMLHRIREMMRQKAPSLLTGEVQADETFVGGKNKNRHANKKIKESQGRSTKDKTPVFGAHNKGRVNLKVVANTKAKTLKPIIEKMVAKGSIIITDEWGAYNHLSKNYQHEVVKHNNGQYVSNGFHTNSMEGFWSLLKRGIFGIYHSTSPQHLHRYCDEFAYRYNTRNLADPERFTASLSQVNGRLTYKQLINK